MTSEREAIVVGDESEETIEQIEEGTLMAEEIIEQVEAGDDDGEGDADGEDGAEGDGGTDGADAGGAESEACSICGHWLTAEASVVRGIGPVCLARVARYLQIREAGEGALGLFAKPEEGKADPMTVNPFVMGTSALLTVFGGVVEQLENEDFDSIVEALSTGRPERPDASAVLSAEEASNLSLEALQSEGSGWVPFADYLRVMREHNKSSNYAFGLMGGHSARGMVSPGYESFYAFNKRWVRSDLLTEEALALLPDQRQAWNTLTPEQRAERQAIKDAEKAAKKAERDALKSAQSEQNAAARAAAKEERAVKRQQGSAERVAKLVEEKLAKKAEQAARQAEVAARQAAMMRPGKNDPKTNPEVQMAAAKSRGAKVKRTSVEASAEALA